MAKRKQAGRDADVPAMSFGVMEALAAIDEYLAAGVGEVVPPGWYSIQQLADARGCSYTRQSQIMRPLVTAGVFEMRKFRIKQNQILRPVNHYRPVKQNGKTDSAA